MIKKLIFASLIACSVCSENLLEENSTSITESKSRKIRLLSEKIFDYPYLCNISPYLEIPEHSMCRLTKNTAAHFMDRKFSYHTKVSERYGIPGLLKAKGILWFDGMNSLKDDVEVFLPCLAHALIRQNLFHSNGKLLSGYFIERFCSLDQESKIAVFLQSENKPFLNYLLKSGNFDLLFGIFSAWPDMFGSLFEGMLFRFNWGPFFDALKSYPDYVQTYNGTPVGFFFQEIAPSLLSDIFNIFTGLNTSEIADSGIYNSFLEIIERMRMRTDELVTESDLEFWTIMNEFQFGSRSDYSIVSIAAEKDWSPIHLSRIAKAAVCAGKFELFNAIFQSHRSMMVEQLRLELNVYSREPVSAKYILHLLTLLSTEEIDIVKNTFMFRKFVPKHYDLVELSERESILYNTFAVKSEFREYGIPERIDIQIDFGDLEYWDNGAYEVDLFSVINSIRLLARQLQNCTQYLSLLPRHITVSKETILMMREIENMEAKEFIYFILKFDEEDSIEIFDGSVPDLELLNPEMYRLNDIIRKLSTNSHFANFEIFVKADLATFLIPVLNSLEALKFDTYAMFRLALRYIKNEYPDRLVELTQPKILELFGKETNHLWETAKSVSVTQNLNE